MIRIPPPTPFDPFTANGVSRMIYFLRESEFDKIEKTVNPELKFAWAHGITIYTGAFALRRMEPMGNA